MKSIFAAISVAAFVLVAGSASAQSVVAVGSGPHSATGTLNLYQTVGPVPCGLNISVDASGGVGYSTTGASPASPYTLCSFPGLGSVQITSDWLIEPISGDYTKVKIKNLTANALGGTCGPGDLDAEVISTGAPMVIYIDGSISGSPASCSISGYVTLTDLQLI